MGSRTDEHCKRRLVTQTVPTPTTHTTHNHPAGEVSDKCLRALLNRLMIRQQKKASASKFVDSACYSHISWTVGAVFPNSKHMHAAPFSIRQSR